MAWELPERRQGLQTCGTGFEPRTSQLRRRSANHYIETFCMGWAEPYFPFTTAASEDTLITAWKTHDPLVDVMSSGNGSDPHDHWWRRWIKLVKEKTFRSQVTWVIYLCACLSSISTWMLPPGCKMETNVLMYFGVAMRGSNAKPKSSHKTSVTVDRKKSSRAPQFSARTKSLFLH